MILHGDCREVLRTLPEASVDMCVTSPPYWGLRDYGVDGQLGLEQTPCEYVASMVAIFAGVRRVLTAGGTLWLNLGDSYQNAKGQAHGVDPKQPARRHGLRPQDVSIAGLKPKDLVGIPWMVAFALRADGWYLRSDIIWAKPNPMPESVTDRPTKAHEYLFLLSKSKTYHYDAAAIAEPCSDAMFAQVEQGYGGEGTKDYATAGVQNPSSVKARIIGNARKRADQFGGTKYNGKNEATGDRRKEGFNEWDESEAGKHSDGSVYTGRFTRNRRTVWTIPTQPYAEAHFAVMPEALVEPCIRAGSRAGGTVLDPFAGAGTVGVVCEKLQRKFLGIELNPAYIAIAEKRIQDIAPLFAERA